MPRFQKWWLFIPLAATIGCNNARDPGKGFRLSGDADIQRGRTAFLEFGCNHCHRVQGANMPEPSGNSVLLGGSVVSVPSDGYLVTAIINPAYHAARYPATGSAANHPNAMPDFAPRMTVQQLTDIVGYVHSRYALSPVQAPGEYP